MSKRKEPTRERGVVFKINDRVIVCHGTIMETMIKGDVQRNERPKSVDEDWTIGSHGTIIDMYDKDGNSIQNVTTESNDFENKIFAKVELDYQDVFGSIEKPSKDFIEVFDKDSLVNISLLGKAPAEHLYEVSRDKDLSMWKLFHPNRILPNYLENVVLEQQKQCYKAKHRMFETSAYMTYYELFHDMVQMNQLYRFAMHTQFADGEISEDDVFRQEADEPVDTDSD
jgi:hypothetical protein